MLSPKKYMTDQQIYSVVTAIVFAFVAFAHVWRLMNGIAVSVAGTPVPDWVSWVGLIVTGLLAVFGIWLAFEKPKVP